MEPHWPRTRWQATVQSKRRGQKKDVGKEIGKMWLKGSVEGCISFICFWVSRSFWVMFVVATHWLDSQLWTILDGMVYARGAARLLRLSSKRLQQRLEGEFSMGFRLFKGMCGIHKWSTYSDFFQVPVWKGCFFWNIDRLVRLESLLKDTETIEPYTILQTGRSISSLCIFVKITQSSSHFMHSARWVP